MPEDATPFDPNLTPRLIPRESEQPDPRSAGAWGVWGKFAGAPVLITNGRRGTATLWRSVGGNPPPHGSPRWLQIGSAPGASSSDSAGSSSFEVDRAAQRDPSRDRMDWGTWNEFDGSQLLVTGGAMGRDDQPALWWWRPGEEAFHPFGIGETDVPWWGAWGQVDGRAVLATGGQGGLIHLWDPADFQRITSFGVNDGGLTAWGAWGLENGEPVLATGGRTGVQRWPASSLREPTASWGAELPELLTGPETVWGAWSTVAGDSVLATGDSTGAVRLFSRRTDQMTILHFGTARQSQSLGAETWGQWAQLRGAPVLIVGVGSGDVWFCDPVTGATRSTSLHKKVVWGTWSVVDGRPMLATADEADEVQFWDLVWERAVPRVPRYSSDTGGAGDRLNRLHDAAALADVITARSARPPLAVGLFGQWGDGKSTFLEMLQEQVGERARTAGPGDPIAHGNIRQVRFNAWHYAEADLWASLVAELFAQLSDGSDPVRDQRQRSRLASELVQARGLREQLDAAEKRLAELRQADAGKDWQSLSPAARLDLQAVLGADAEKLYKEVVITSSTTQLTGHSLKRLLKAISPRGWLTAAGLLAVAVALAIWGPGLIRWWLAAVPLLAAIAATARDGWSRIESVRELAGSAWQTVRRIRDEQKQRLETAEAVAAAEVEELRKRVQNLTSAGQLAGVVQERAGAASYRERLGLMTQIRQDFERMAELLRPDDPAQNDVPVVDAAGDELPAIDRIVIYIDDLDRCPPDRVIDVLEAVHLLLAVRLFVVVVAVDPRWLLRSLASHYREIFEEADDELRATTPAQYLEKIFQIVLTLPPMEQDGYQRMITDLVGVRAPVEETSISSVAPVADATEPAPDARLVSAEVTWEPDEPLDLSSLVVDRVDPLALTPDEYRLINLLGPPLITGPRSVKRLANSYGLLIATRALTGERTDLQPVPDRGGSVALPYRAGMVLLAAVIGFPMLGPELFPDLHAKARSNPRLPWTDYLAELRPTESGNRLDPTMAPAQVRHWNELLDALAKISERAALDDLPLPQELQIWAQWVIPVGRLSFPTGSAVSKLFRSSP
ncbi:KAP-like P-loop domain-containing protein [Kribbella voronezhensis]|uniref:KAP-like P-loop domain-containing protein n=1 Tax=Kribbella voronezhensis TaxID=2512212 RepID=A0A4R7SVL3_9ACTN|nr:P-loop NTPase fold protein [Kribbella voronezhensis]TDU82427.1 KAP-like P-loop domain-containing protein [Kribbella voronezhensis]